MGRIQKVRFGKFVYKTDIAARHVHRHCSFSLLKRTTKMVAGEPNDVRLKNVDRKWIVQVVEDGKLTPHLFTSQAVAESYAEFQRVRLGLPGKPPIWEKHSG